MGFLTGISTFAGLGASIFGNLKSAQAQNNAEKKINGIYDGQNRTNTGVMLDTVNTDSTQLADAQRAITLGRNAALDNRANITGEQEVMGASKKVLNNEDLADTLSSISAAGTARKDTAMDRYLNMGSKLATQYTGVLENWNRDKQRAFASGVKKVNDAVSDVQYADALSTQNTGYGLYENWIKNRKKA